MVGNSHKGLTTRFQERQTNKSRVCLGSHEGTGERTRSFNTSTAALLLFYYVTVYWSRTARQNTKTGERTRRQVDRERLYTVLTCGWLRSALPDMCVLTRPSWRWKTQQILKKLTRGHERKKYWEELWLWTEYIKYLSRWRNWTTRELGRSVFSRYRGSCLFAGGGKCQYVNGLRTIYCRLPLLRCTGIPFRLQNSWTANETN